MTGLEHGFQFLKFVGNAKEVGTVYLIYGATLGNAEALVGVLAGMNFVLDNGDFGGLHHTLDEQHTSNNQANLDGNGEVEDDGEEEGNKQNGNIALGVLHQSLDGAPFAHIVTDNQQYSRQSSHGDELGIGHQHQQDEYQHYGMDDTCYGGAAAVVDIGHRTGYGTCGRDTAEERCNHVCHTLSHQFGVGVVAVANGSVGNSSTEQTLNSAQYSYGECHRQKVLQGVEGETGHYHVGQLCLNVKAVANGVYAFHAELALEHEYGQCAHQNTIQRTGNLVQHRHTLQCHGREDYDKQ